MTDFETHPIGTAARIAELEAEIARLDAGWHDANKRVLEALTRANAATAAAYEVAAREVECGCGAGPCQDTANCAAKDAAAIRALATPDQTAALDKLIAEAVGPLMDALDAVLAWHDKDKHTSGKMTFERSSVFAKARAASKKGGV